MTLTPALFPALISAIAETITEQADAVTELDQAIGDGDHVFNLQRGIQALQAAAPEISGLDWPAAWQKIGMLLMSSVGGASGSLYATLFINLAKNSKDSTLSVVEFARLFDLAVTAVKQRGKADAGEKTMLDVLIPVAVKLQQDAAAGLTLAEIYADVRASAEAGVAATRDMLATKGRASFLGERSIGHIDAGAKTAQLMIAAVSSVLAQAGE
ncbi:dihydroxyacetone kinase subunit L [Methylomonas paludis]|uniref:Dihydroxyacetone kinase subunit L n=1 Tax=Methylomonas paludis TaxID=1173101 RepID=A0A975MR62_9GAMM|nr:dihydroxyacetone kinase subunit DhaL [Methylomonas paludis]QWF72254.1 dihydroxyacetone kinase subunit L [Methylomonas paludis]